MNRPRTRQRTYSRHSNYASYYRRAVTIPAKIREILGITPETEVDFIEEGGKFYIVKKSSSDEIFQNVGRFEKLRGIATVKMTTDEIMALTRDSE